MGFRNPIDIGDNNDWFRVPDRDPIGILSHQQSFMSHILVVDDSPMDRLVAGKCLEEAETNYFIEYASDGIEALEHMESKLPLAVVTDLQMPDMDGMQLVKAIHQSYPKVPVILMTAFGSEDIALEALLLGAADYVPKTRLKSDLAESLRSVLALSVPDRPHQRLGKCLRLTELQYELDNDVLLIPPLIEHLQQVAFDLGLIDRTDSLRFARSLLEALRNAIYHGNLELPFDQIKTAGWSADAASRLIRERLAKLPFRDRRIHVQATFSPEEARITVRDDGRGYDTSILPDIKADPSLLCEGERRGLVLIAAFMDDFHVTPPGNEITLIKRKKTPA